MKVFRIVIVITSLVAILFNKLSLLSIVLLIIMTCIMLAFTNRFSLYGNLTKYVVLFVYWMSVIFMPSFHMVQPIMPGFYVEITSEWNNKILEFGIPTFFYSVVVLYIIGRAFSKKEVGGKDYCPLNISVRFVCLFIVACIFLSIFCYSIGLGRFGSEAVILPFHLGGIINLFRKVAVPILFSLFVESFIIRKKTIPLYIWGLYVFWALIEIFVWMSKSIFVSHLEPVLLVLLFYYRPSAKTIFKVAVPILAVFLAVYPLIEFMRTSDREGSLYKSVIDAKSASDEEGNRSVLTPLNRTFMFAQQFPQDYTYIDNSQLFNFSNVPILLLNGGAAGFQTHYVDGYPLEANHSSGTSGLMDPLLHGGVGLMMIVIFFVCLLASFSDRLIKKEKYGIATIFLLMCFGYSNFVNISTLYDSVGIQTLFVYIVCIIIARHINYRKRSY